MGVKKRLVVDLEHRQIDPRRYMPSTLRESFSLDLSG